MPMIIPALMYHSLARRSLDYLTVSQSQFARQIDHLAQKYQIVALRDVRQFLQGQAPLPDRPVLITFDDGFIDTIQYGLPVLKQFEARAVFFIVVRYLGQDNSWDHKAPRIVRHMTAGDVQALLQSGYEIGNHSLSHQRLSKLSIKTLRREFQESHSWLTRLLGEAPVAFSYPYGDADHRSLTLCQSLYPFGFATVRQGEFDWLKASANIRRIYVSPQDGPADLDRKIDCYLDQRQHA